MKYSDLPSEKLIQKLLATSFASPSENRAVYNWSESVLKHVRFLENERVKLIKEYGSDNGNGFFTVDNDNIGIFGKKFSELLNMEIDEEISDCPVKEDWFNDETCSYPKEKELWITPKEIAFLAK